ncbi:hypothetical protein RchiOBHm_Chr6g0285811 [Rosa chinensis]|uniref:Uncharacterized protein n=1 Tax=Rosa chinensis TaxID=74649 RepID=A0A2P6PUM7_ROSCH|nr:hypothetical protein RchiOBHm_Chr6g0285811 [Rosa chinensis]
MGRHDNWREDWARFMWNCIPWSVGWISSKFVSTDGSTGSKVSSFSTSLVGWYFHFGICFWQI